ncbi:hypothetical protein BGX38DRAFT_1276524 [Terfezia claveryi]|nr:hypothetical protein BGX38DRAFT_1276524 [Terfezia claveryi]
MSKKSRGVLTSSGRAKARKRRTPTSGTEPNECFTETGHWNQHKGGKDVSEDEDVDEEELREYPERRARERKGQMSKEEWRKVGEFLLQHVVIMLEIPNDGRMHSDREAKVSDGELGRGGRGANKEKPTLGKRFACINNYFEGIRVSSIIIKKPRSKVEVAEVAVQVSTTMVDTATLVLSRDVDQRKWLGGGNGEDEKRRGKKKEKGKGKERAKNRMSAKTRMRVYRSTVAPGRKYEKW